MSRPWLRRIIALLSPRSFTSASCSRQVDHDAVIIVVADLGEAHRGLRVAAAGRIPGSIPPCPAQVWVWIDAGDVGLRHVDRRYG